MLSRYNCFRLDHCFPLIHRESVSAPMMFAFYYFISGIVFISGVDSRPQPLLLISLDGFRWDFACKAHTPYLDFLTRTGVTVPYVRSVFPTVTYPGHYSIVTGLYPESHGIVSNTMYDPDLKERFGAANTDPRWWNAAEPIWVTNQRYNGRSAVLYWPGYNVKIKGQYPKYREYSPSPNVDQNNKTGKVLPFKKRVDKVIRWLTVKNAPNFVALYFEEPDKTCHHQGRKKVCESMRNVDKTIGRLVEGLKQHKLLDKVNIIITSDHGMANTSCNKIVDLDKYVDPKNFDFWDSWFNMLLTPKPGKLEYVYDRLKNVSNLHIYLKNEVPEYLHFRKNSRISPLVVIPSEGWLVSSIKGRHVQDDPVITTELSHGFNCKCKSMSTAFIARGPAFKENFCGKPFESVSLYPLMCKVLGIQPLPNNGSLEATADLLKPTTKCPTS